MKSATLCTLVCTIALCLPAGSVVVGGGGGGTVTREGLQNGGLEGAPGSGYDLQGPATISLIAYEGTQSVDLAPPLAMPSGTILGGVIAYTDGHVPFGDVEDFTYRYLIDAVPADREIRLQHHFLLDHDDDGDVDSCVGAQDATSLAATSWTLRDDRLDESYWDAGPACRLGSGTLPFATVQTTHANHLVKAVGLRAIVTGGDPWPAAASVLVDDLSLPVGDDGRVRMTSSACSSDHATIQAAVDAADACNAPAPLILVSPGTYEGFEVPSSLTDATICRAAAMHTTCGAMEAARVGAVTVHGKDTTLAGLSATGAATVVAVTADDVTLEDLEVAFGGGTGVLGSGDRLTVTGTSFSGDGGTAVTLTRPHTATVSGNTFAGSTTGIRVIEPDTLPAAGDELDARANVFAADVHPTFDLQGAYELFADASLTTWGRQTCELIRQSILEDAAQTVHVRLEEPTIGEGPCPNGSPDATISLVPNDSVMGPDGTLRVESEAGFYQFTITAFHDDGEGLVFSDWRFVIHGANGTSDFGSYGPGGTLLPNDDGDWWDDVQIPHEFLDQRVDDVVTLEAFVKDNAGREWRMWLSEPSNMHIAQGDHQDADDTYDSVRTPLVFTNMQAG